MMDFGCHARVLSFALMRRSRVMHLLSDSDGKTEVVNNANCIVYSTNLSKMNALASAMVYLEPYPTRLQGLYLCARRVPVSLT